MKKINRIFKFVCILLIFILTFGLSYVNIVGQNKGLPIPVLGASINSWDINSYWQSSWGISKVHKGIDIFATNKA